MKKIKRDLHLNLLILFLIFSAIVLAFFYVLSNRITEVDRSEYLISLRENSTVGCLSFSQLRNNILVIGDSHAYAGLDFYKLAQLTGTQKISSCTMGGLYFETLIELLGKIESAPTKPKNIIFGLSLRQFTSGSDKEKQMAEHHTLINSAKPINRNLFLNIKNNFETYFTPEESKMLLKERNQQVSYWGPVFNALKAESVELLFDKLDHPGKYAWRKYFSQLKFLDSNKVNIEKFCTSINKIQANLFLVDLPESPYLESQYKKEDIEQYQLVIAELSKCSKGLVKMSRQEWGIESRHFLNSFRHF